MAVLSPRRESGGIKQLRGSGASVLCGAQPQHVGGEGGFVGTSECPWDGGGDLWDWERRVSGDSAVTGEGRDPGDRGPLGGVLSPQLKVSPPWVQLGVPPGFIPIPPHIFKPLLSAPGPAPPSIATPKMAPGMNTRGLARCDDVTRQRHTQKGGCWIYLPPPRPTFRRWRRRQGALRPFR